MSGEVKSYRVSCWTLVTFRALGLLTVVLERLQGGRNDGSTGLKVYWIRGFGTDFLPSGVMILTACREMTSGGGTLLVAQSQ
jgi:hypothetical protein